MPTEPLIYHGVPPQMLGETLYPLYELKSLSPERYRTEIAKYDDHPARRKIPLAHVAKLNCTYIETLNFAPVHPHIIYRAWQELGVTLKSVLWFGVPLERLGASPAVITLPEAERAVGEDYADDAVRWLEPAHYRELTVLPEATLRWYERLVQEKRRGAWFAHVPHVLVRGRVSVAGLTPLDWSLPR